VTDTDPPVTAAATLRGPLARRAVRLEQLTIGYNIVEGVIAVTFGLLAGSIALTGFGFDSWIEVAAATVVLQRLRAELRHGQVDETKQRRALRFVAFTFFALAAYLVVEGIRDLRVRCSEAQRRRGVGPVAARVSAAVARARRVRREMGCVWLRITMRQPTGWPWWTRSKTMPRSGILHRTSPSPTSRCSRASVRPC
jgi:hypothetical protein